MIAIQNMKTPGTIFTILFYTLIAAPVYSSPMTDTYATGDTLTATKMNNIKSAVNDNDGRIDANTIKADANTVKADANTAKADANTVKADANTVKADANTVKADANTADIAALQAASTCPSDMVASGTLCIDKFEASVWNAATGGNQISGAASAIYNTCSDTGSNCTNAIYARSVTDVQPAYDITQYQAAIACANVGKRLPTVSEWLIAAAGTTESNGDGAAANCNNEAGGGGSLRNTGSPANCVSAAGAFDMIGNVWELTSDFHFGAVANGTAEDISTNATTAKVVALGGDFADNASIATTMATFVLAPTDNLNTTLGFRCVKDL